MTFLGFSQKKLGNNLALGDFLRIICPQQFEMFGGLVVGFAARSPVGR
jgi:hypothetical protein